MAISLDEVNRIAKLARLSFNEDEKQKLQQELSAILDFVDQLKEIQDKSQQSEAIDPMTVNLMRDDVAEVTILPEEFLKQSPSRQENFVKVKSILE